MIENAFGALRPGLRWTLTERRSRQSKRVRKEKRQKFRISQVETL